jgi:hypothetical protein
MNSELLQHQEPSLQTSSLCVENDFFHRADLLRAQFERLMSMSVPANSGLTPFSYAFCQNAYQFLTVGAERVFEPEILDDLIHSLGAWAKKVLRTSHVSTPQLRIYINGCYRNLLCDDVSAPWRYALSLTKTLRPGRTGPVNVLIDGDSPLRRNLSLKKLANSHLLFNQLLVHWTNNAYSIEAAAGSMNPVEGNVFLDGYFW